LIQTWSLEQTARLEASFGGGANEIQRDLIAQFGLGLQRAKR